MKVWCTHCGGQHPAWDCKASDRKKAEWAARSKPIPGGAGTWVKPPPKESSEGSSAVEQRVARAHVAGSSPAPRSKEQPAADSGKRGRPKIHPDRKAYKAQKERERRAKKKAET